jgi:antitoxin component YwqK of YwqJK toxin-antitoxin module
MRLFLVPLILIIYSGSWGQCKTYKISSKGDTLNCTDISGIKRGLWVVHVEPLRGAAGYEEEGTFINDKKEGTWRTFNLMGDLMAIENFRWGNKNGKCQYYNLMGLEHEESWKALNPAKPIDTIDVQDPKYLEGHKVDRVIIVNEGHSLKHGTWKYYNPAYGNIIKVENYLLDEIQTEDPQMNDILTVFDGVDSTKEIKAKATEKPKGKPKEVEDFEKKNKNKKKITIRDGKTG